MIELRRFRETEIAWGDTLCEAGCFRAAALLEDYASGAGVPLCVDCAELLLERWLAAADLGRQVVHLPDLFGREELRPPRRDLPDWEIAHRTPSRWLAEQGFWAGRPDPAVDPDWDIPF